MVEEITHKGVIRKLSEKKIIVGIVNESACASCHAQGACSAADMKDKEIEITRFDGDYRLGQTVIIVGKTSQGFKALFLGYLLPFILVLSTLIITTTLSVSETRGGLLSLAILIPYYGLLYAFRNKIKKSFEFEIKPLQ